MSSDAHFVKKRLSAAADKNIFFCFLQPFLLSPPLINHRVARCTLKAAATKAAKTATKEKSILELYGGP